VKTKGRGVGAREESSARAGEGSPSECLREVLLLELTRLPNKGEGGIESKSSKHIHGGKRVSGRSILKTKRVESAQKIDWGHR